MSLIVSRWEGNGIVSLIPALDNLKDNKLRRAFRMALNDTGKKMYTEVKRSLAIQVGVSQATIVRRGALRKKFASNNDLTFQVISRGEYMPLKDFRPTQFKKGVKAAPWGQRKTFKGSFIVDKLGGHVFKNTGQYSRKSERFNAIEKMYGPAIPNEMLKDLTAASYFKTVKQLDPRLDHILRQMLKGTFN